MEAAQNDRPVRFEADQCHQRDVKDPGALLGENRKQAVRRRFTRDEGCDLAERGLLAGELASALFCALEGADSRRPGATGAGSADEIRLALTQRLRHGNRPVLEDELATALRNLNRGTVLRFLAVERIALPIYEQIGASGHQIGVATPQPGVSVAPVVQEAPLHRRRGGAHQLQTPGMGDLPEAREIDESHYLAGHRVVHRRAGAEPLVVALVEVLESEHLKRVIRGERRPDTVRAIDRLAEECALHEIHLGRARLQRIGPVDAQEEPGGIAHHDQALRLLGYLPELRREHGSERAKRMLEPALMDRRRVRLDRNHQFGWIKTRPKRTPPRLEDRRAQSCHRVRWKLRAERALGEQSLPAPLQLSSAAQRIRLKPDSQPRRRHGSITVLSTSPTVRCAPFSLSRR